MNRKDLAQAMARARPEWGGYGQLGFARVEAVHQQSGLHERLAPVAALDLTLLDERQKPIKDLPIIEAVPWARSSRHLCDPPRVGDLVLLAFIGGWASNAWVIGVLPTGQELAPVEGTLELAGADRILIGAGTPERAVLGETLIAKLEELIDAVVDLGNGGTVSGGPLNKAGAFALTANDIKGTLDQVLSDIELGKNTST